MRGAMAANTYRSRILMVTVSGFLGLCKWWESWFMYLMINWSQQKTKVNGWKDGRHHDRRIRRTYSCYLTWRYIVKLCFFNEFMIKLSPFQSVTRPCRNGPKWLISECSAPTDVLAQNFVTRLQRCYKFWILLLDPFLLRVYHLNI